MKTIETKLGRVTFSAHAYERLNQRDVSITEIIETINNPKRKQPSLQRKDHLLFFGKRDLMIAFNPIELVIITVMRRNFEMEKQKRVHARRDGLSKYGKRLKPKKPNRLKPWRNR